MAKQPQNEQSERNDPKLNNDPRFVAAMRQHVHFNELRQEHIVSEIDHEELRWDRWNSSSLSFASWATPFCARLVDRRAHWAGRKKPATRPAAALPFDVMTRSAVSRRAFVTVFVSSAPTPPSITTASRVAAFRTSLALGSGIPCAVALRDAPNPEREQRVHGALKQGISEHRGDRRGGRR